jgi:hypothetical protein
MPPSVPATELDGHYCGRTGLRLVSPPRFGLWRVAKSEYGAVNPPVRTGTEYDEWCRFDLPGRRTMYAASSRVGAYAEALASLRPSLSTIPFADIFPDIDAGDDPVAADFQDRGYLAPGHIPKQWRVDRCIAQVAVHAGWCIDVNDVKSLAALRRGLGPTLGGLGCRDLDGGIIRSENRSVTVGIASWVAAQVLHDGSEPLGIRYRSRLNDDWRCWALWGGIQGAPVPADEVGQSAIELHDCDLMALRDLWGLWFF